MSRKQGLLIYTPADAARNRWFIEQLCQYAESEGISLRLCLSDASPAEIMTPQTDVVINRSRLAQYSIYAQSRGIPCFNSAAVTEITNDKYRTYRSLHLAHGIPMAETWEIRQGAPLPAAQTPCIAKPADGHGGEGVFLLRDANALHQYAAAASRPFLLQESMVFAWDMRVYVLGGEIYTAVLRTSETDFRSNVSLGGQATFMQPDAEICELVRRVQRILPLDFAGVDILRHPCGGYVLGEIEDAVGCRMLYQCTDRNPARDFIRYVAVRIKER